MIEAFLTYLATADKMPWILGAIAAVLGYFFNAAQKGQNPFDFKEMFYDPDTKLTSMTRFGTFVALVVSSWGCVYLITHGQLTEMYFTVYMSVWTGANLVSKGIAAYNSRRGDGPPDKDNDARPN